jgi:diketogulonate reductase-like aldo/keto reductase
VHEKITDLTLASTVTLANGVAMPRLGLGVFRAGRDTYDAVRAALDLGYRHVDTAAVYGNEGDVGRAIRESGVPREQIFVTTKLWNEDQGHDEALAAFDASLSRLGLDYVDLYLLHWPVPEKRLGSWRALAHLVEGDRLRAIGVSNFMPRHLDELIEETGVVPTVDQIELHPFHAQRPTRALCEKLGIVVEAYSPLTKGKRLDDPTVAAIAKAHEKTVAQVMIRWSLEHGHVVIPKSSKKERIAENADVFDFALTDEERTKLDGLDEHFVTAWDPTDAP